LRQYIASVHSFGNCNNTYARLTIAVYYRPVYRRSPAVLGQKRRMNIYCAFGGDTGYFFAYFLAERYDNQKVGLFLPDSSDDIGCIYVWDFD
jgi:hypothetical protein